MALADLCEINVGRTPSRSESRYWGQGEPWLSIGDMAQGARITRTKEQITALGAASGRQVEAGTVVLSFKLSIGKVAIAGMPLYTNEAIAALPVKNVDQLNPLYLMRALEALDLRGGANRAAMGATLNKKMLAEIAIPLPGLETQHRIALVLDQADELRAKRRQVAAHLGTLVAAVYESMFADTAWTTAPLRSLGRVTTGRTPPTGGSHFGGSIPFVTPGDLGSGRPVVRSLTTQGAGLSRTVRAGATLVCCIGATIGKVARAVDTSAFNQQINAVEWHDAVNDWYGLETLRKLKPVIVAQGASTTMPLLSKGKFQSMEIPVPPIELQEIFANRVRAIERDYDHCIESSSLHDTLFNALQARAFRGGL